MLSKIYKLPRALLASLLIGGGIIYLLMTDPPHSICDTQLENFSSKASSRLNSKKITCQSEGGPGSCYEYFAEIRGLFQDFKLVSEDCAPLLYSQAQIRQTLAGALTLMTALAWREEALSGKVSKYNWLGSADMSLFCKVKQEYIFRYGREAYKALESQILSQLPLEQKVSPAFLRKKTILSEPCQSYR